MGTRADFYIGRGEKAEWLGSIAWDGYPRSIPKPILKAKTEEEFKMNVVRELAKRDDGTFPEMGWPWPWNDSQTTDYAYAFTEGKVWASCFGYEWFDPLKEEPDHIEKKSTIFPDMSGIKKTTFGKRSGIMMIYSDPSGKIKIKE